MKFLLLILAGLVGLAGLGLYVLARTSKPLPTIEEFLATLPASERAALTALCASAGTKPEALRALGGVSDPDFSFRHALNRTAIAIADGHVRSLGLTGAKFSTTLDFRGFPELEVLWLENGSLSQWPDLSSLTNLRFLNLNGVALPSPAPGTLPVNLRIVRLARAKVTDLAGFAELKKLAELDLSDNAGITAVDPIAGLLELGPVNLANTSIAKLPDTVPPQSQLVLNLQGTPVVNPSGFSWKGPGSYSFGGTGLGNTTLRGVVRAGAVDVTGMASEVPALRPVSMPSNRGGTEAIGNVVVEATIATGKARIWLSEGKGWFDSPWFLNGRVKGFGFVRSVGWVTGDFKAGDIGKLRGRLHLPGSSDHSDFQFYIEPLDGTKVTGLQFKVYSEN